MSELQQNNRDNTQWSMFAWFKERNVIQVYELIDGNLKGRDPKWIVKPMFAWYDMWVGVYVDRKQRRVYVMLIPCCGFVVYWG